MPPRIVGFDDQFITIENEGGDNVRVPTVFFPGFRPDPIEAVAEPAPEPVDVGTVPPGAQPPLPAFEEPVPPPFEPVSGSVVAPGVAPGETIELEPEPALPAESVASLQRPVDVGAVPPDVLPFAGPVGGLLGQQAAQEPPTDAITEGDIAREAISQGVPPSTPARVIGLDFDGTVQEIATTQAGLLSRQQAVADAQRRLSEATSAQQDEQAVVKLREAEALRKQREEFNERQLENTRRVNEEVATMRQQIQELHSGGVTRLLTNASTLGKMGILASLVMGGLVSARTGRNPALESLFKLIDLDLNAQANAIGKQNNLINTLINQGNSEADSFKLARAAMLQEYKSQLESATLATNNPIVKSRGELEVAKVQSELDKTFADMSKAKLNALNQRELSLLGMQARQRQRGTGGGVPGKPIDARGRVIWHDPSGRTRLVGVARFRRKDGTADPAAAQKVSDNILAFNTVQTGLDEMVRLGTTVQNQWRNGFDLTKSTEFARLQGIKAGILMPMLRAMGNAGAVTDSDIALAERTIPTPSPANLHNEMIVVLDRLESVIKGHMSFIRQNVQGTTADGVPMVDKDGNPAPPNLGYAEAMLTQVNIMKRTFEGKELSEAEKASRTLKLQVPKLPTPTKRVDAASLTERAGGFISRLAGIPPVREEVARRIIGDEGDDSIATMQGALNTSVNLTSLIRPDGRRVGSSFFGADSDPASLRKNKKELKTALSTLVSVRDDVLRLPPRIGQSMKDKAAAAIAQWEAVNGISVSDFID